MSERKFQCPLCGQKISCDTTMAGAPIQCPACSKEITVPRAVVAIPMPTRSVAEPAGVAVPSSGGSAASPAPPSVPTQTRLSVAKHEAPSASPEQPATPPVPQRPPVPVPMIARSLPLNVTPDGGKKPKRLLTVAGLILALGAAAYFGLPALMSTDEKEVASSKPGESGERRNSADSASSVGTPDPVVQTDSTVSVTAPVWTLDVKSMAIPDGRAHGTIGGKTFAADTARLDPVGQMHLLTLRQGGQTYADREILVYIRLKPGEALEGRTWVVDPSVRTGIPQIVKRWLSDPKLPPQSKPFVNGYAMKLEFGRAKDGGLPGKIFVALPDAEKTVVGGDFTARITLPTPLPTPPPVIPAANRR